MALSTATGKRPMPRRIFAAFVILLTGLLALWTPPPAHAGTTQVPVPQLTVTRKGEGWIAAELRRNRTFPHLDMAFRKEKQGDLRGAVRELEAFLSIDPLDDNVRLQLSFLLSRLGQDLRSEKELSRVVTNHPQEALLYFQRSQIRRRLGRTAGAEEDLNRAIALPYLSPDQRRDIHLALAEIALARQEFATALGQADEAATGEANYQAEMLRGMARSGLGQPERAVANFAEADRLATTPSQRSAALSAAAEAAIALKRYNQAFRFLKTAAALNPPDAALRARLGTLAALENDPQTAADYFQKAVELGDRTSRRPLITVLKELGRLDEAAALAAQLASEAKTAGERAKDFMTLGILREQQGRYQEAADAFQQAADSEPSAAAYLALARTRHRLGRNAEAEKAYSQALNLSPTPDTRLEAALLLAADGRLEEAEILLRQAVSKGLSPARTREGWKQIGLAALARGDSRRADRALGRALQLSPDDPEVARAYGDAALARKSYAEAAQRYQRASQLNRHGKESADGDPLLQAAASWDLAGRPEQSLAAYQRFLGRAGISRAEQGKAWLAVAYLHQKQGRLREAADALTAAAASGGLGLRKKTQVLLSAAGLSSETGDQNRVDHLRGEILELKGRPGPEQAAVLLELARIGLQVGDDATATELLDLALKQRPAPSRATLVEIHETLGYVAQRKGRFREAEENFRQSITLGGENRERLLGLGYALFRQGDWNAAKESFRAAEKIAPGSAGKIALARLYGETGQTGLALYYMGLAESGFPSLAPAEQRTVFREYGFFFDSLGRYQKARFWYQRSLELGKDPVVSYHLARVTYLLGRVDEASLMAEGIAAEALPEVYRTSLLILKARLALARKELETAAGDYRQAIEGEPSRPQNPADLAGTWSELGKVYHEEKDHAAAAAAFAEAAQLSPLPAYRMEQDYEELELRHRQAARPLLAGALAEEPDYLDAHKDLGYLAMQMNDNQEAVSRFRQAVDLLPLQPAATPEEAEKIVYDEHRLRSEIAALNNRFDADIYLTYTSGQTGTQGAVPGAGQDVARGDSGIELAWTPPDIGFRDHKIFKLVTRLTWTFKPDSLDINQDSWCGVLGLRYKPFKAWNVNIGLEKFFAIGDDAEDQTVLRLMGSLQDGEDADPVKSWWNYSFLFSETDAFLESPQRITLYAEGRQGLSLKPFDGFTITPFAVADARWWSHSDADDISFYEGGAGLSLKYRFDQTKYELPRRSVELLLTCKSGRIFDSENVEDDTIDAFFATLFLHF